MKNKKIIITGGTSGIGKYIVKKICKDNMVYILTVNEKEIEKTRLELRKNNKNLCFIRCDITDEKDVNDAFKIIIKKTDTIDIVINNAAFDKMSSIENYNFDTFNKIITTNLCSKMLIIKKSISYLKNSNYPCIINIASRLATKPMIDSAGYCCAAAGIVMLTKCAAIELEKYMIRVNTISPSLTLTPLAKQSYSEKEILETSNRTTRKRLCKEEDIYNLIEFLTSKKSDYINGENINISGGLLLK